MGGDGASTSFALTWSNPWVKVVPEIAGVFLVILAVELVILLVKLAVSSDSGSGGDV